MTRFPPELIYMAECVRGFGWRVVDTTVEPSLVDGSPIRVYGFKYQRHFQSRKDAQQHAEQMNLWHTR